MLLDPHPSSLPTHPSPSPPPPPLSNLLDDIFSSSRSRSRSPRPSPSHPHTHHPSHPTHPSDIPRLRSTHTTAGYREGLAAAKTAALQGGFDEGFTLGAVLGLRVGELLGVLEGVCRALRAGGGRDRDGEKEGEGRQDAEAHAAMERVFELRRAAAVELDVGRVFAAEWWDGDGDGVWRWDVPAVEGGGGGGAPAAGRAAEGEERVTFEAVVAAHPVVRKWTGVVGEVMREWGVERGVFGGEEWEAGRVGE